MAANGAQDRLPVAVIGAGIVGVSTAIWLQRTGHEVILIDRGEPGEGTSYGNGGVLASCSIVPVTVPGLMRKAPRMLFDPRQPLFLRWSYLPRLAPWLQAYLRHCTPEHARRIAAALAPIIGDSHAEHQALSQGTGAEKWLVPSDYVFVYRDRAHFNGDALGWSIRRDHGFRWDELEGQAFRAYDPAFADHLGFAARLPDHGRISDPGRYVKDLAAHVAVSGGRIVKGEVGDLVRENGRVTGVRIGGETLPCSAAVLATGVWSKPLCRKLGLDVPLESERGYHLELWEPSLMPRSPVMVAAGKFVITPMEGRLRLAGIVEFGGLEAPASRAPFALLTKNIQAAMPSLTWKETSEWMGHRPAPTDSIPLIGEVPGAKGAFLGFGHHHVGLTGGPKTGRILAQLISGTAPNLDLAPYAPSRFQ
ncbi:NAD(P)/FAD-dependent oxidoreductase [Chelativorans salis]|uniref:FAD-dependent oxidoreductase n=1 Tax=Chelativorans salis TaxID=2978478 RepID=A0ABT2LRR5_9HYPH|nr:FAD-dependent oxidoreductase [Chelativorans sp. EGI FJ00035]MCT7377056.1 FAD-dependent oxidoreductase [Chelativorans sp. EGI FJ00035]